MSELGAMVEHRKVTCDSCGRDLTSTGNNVDYRLALSNEMLPLAGNTCTDVEIRPQILQDVHFCGLDCLRAWLEATLAKRCQAWLARDNESMIVE